MTGQYIIGLILIESMIGDTHKCICRCGISYLKILSSEIDKNNSLFSAITFSFIDDCHNDNIQRIQEISEIYTFKKRQIYSQHYQNTNLIFTMNY